MCSDVDAPLCNSCREVTVCRCTRLVLIRGQELSAPEEGCLLQGALSAAAQRGFHKLKKYREDTRFPVTWVLEQRIITGKCGTCKKRAASSCVSFYLGRALLYVVARSLGTTS